MTPPKKADFSQFTKALEMAANDPNIKAMKDAVTGEVKRATGVDVAPYVPSSAEAIAMIRALGRASEGHRKHSEGEKNTECQVPSDYYPVEQNHSETTQTHPSSHPEFVWVQTSKAENSQAMNAMARELLPNGAAHQDSLKVFCQDAEMGKMLKGEQQSGNGATLMLPKNQMQATLLALAVKMESPEFANAWSLIQTIVPFVMSGETGAIHSELQKFLQKLPAGMDTRQFVGSMLETLHQSGLSSIPEMKEIMLAMLKASGLQNAALEEPFDGLGFKMNSNLNALAMSGIPQANGVAELLGGNLTQGLNQVLQPLMRILTGLFFMKTETPVPKFIPDEKIMSELAALFAAKSQGPKKEKNKRTRKDKKGFFGFRPTELPEAIPSQSENSTEEEMQEAKFLKLSLAF